LRSDGFIIRAQATIRTDGVIVRAGFGKKAYALRASTSFSVRIYDIRTENEVPYLHSGNSEKTAAAELL